MIYPQKFDRLKSIGLATLLVLAILIPKFGYGANRIEDGGVVDCLGLLHALANPAGRQSFTTIDGPTNHSLLAALSDVVRETTTPNRGDALSLLEAAGSSNGPPIYRISGRARVAALFFAMAEEAERLSTMPRIDTPHEIEKIPRLMAKAELDRPIREMNSRRRFFLTGLVGLGLGLTIALNQGVDPMTVFRTLVLGVITFSVWNILQAKRLENLFSTHLAPFFELERYDRRPLGRVLQAQAMSSPPETPTVASWGSIEFDSELPIVTSPFTQPTRSKPSSVFVRHLVIIRRELLPEAQPNPLRTRGRITHADDQYETVAYVVIQKDSPTE